MANVTYIIIEGETETDDDIASFVRTVENTIKTQFAPRKITVAIQDVLIPEPTQHGLADPDGGYS
jgi:hypothetical protein